MRLGNVLSCFDGISCAQIALGRAGITFDTYYASEIDKYSMSRAMANYPATVQLGSIENWREWNLENINLIVGGSPCEGFSMAGKMLNFADPRSKLFFTFADIINHYTPKWFLLENVPMEKWAENVITDALNVDPVEINGALVSAQNRRRNWWTNIPIVGKPKDKGILLKDILEREVDKKYYVSDKVLARLNKSQDVEAEVITHSLQPRNGKGIGGKGHLFKTDGKSYAVDTNNGQAVEVTNIGVDNSDGNLREVPKSLSIDANYHKGMDNHAQRTMVLLEPNVFGEDRIHEDKAPTIMANPNGGTENPFVMLQRPRGNNMGGEVAKDGKTPSVSSSSWEHNNLLIEPHCDAMRGRGEAGNITQNLKPNLTGKTNAITTVQKDNLIMEAHGVNEPSRGIEARKDQKAATVKSASGGASKPKVMITSEEPFLSENHSHRGPRYYYGKSQTLLGHMGTGGGNVPFVNNIRRLTELEVERLFTVPEGYTAGVSSTQRYKMLSKGWIVDVAAWIFEFMKDGEPRNGKTQRGLFE